jgi:hypothetical protein
VLLRKTKRRKTYGNWTRGNPLITIRGNINKYTNKYNYSNVY